MANQGSAGDNLGRLKQGGTAKLKLSPLHGAGAFFIALQSKSEGGGFMESDLGELETKPSLSPLNETAVSLNIAAKTFNRPR